MTNGEKMQAVFPDIEMWGESKDTLDYSLGGMIHRISKDWWNAEYKEPSNSEKPNELVEERCPCYDCEHFEIKGWSYCKIHEDAYGDSRCNDYHKVVQGSNKPENPISSTAKNDLPHCQHTDKEIAKSFIEDVEAVKDQLPTTKNDVSDNNVGKIDCIDRVELLKAMDTWDKFGNVPYEGLIRLSTPALQDRYVLYVKYDDMVNCVKGMTPVTPIVPKGYWIDIDKTHSKCSRCGAVFEICSENGEAIYCPNCSADMREVKE